MMSLLWDEPNRQLFWIVRTWLSRLQVRLVSFFVPSTTTASQNKQPNRTRLPTTFPKNPTQRADYYDTATIVLYCPIAHSPFADKGSPISIHINPSVFNHGVFRPNLFVHIQPLYLTNLTALNHGWTWMDWCGWTTNTVWCGSVFAYHHPTRD